MTIGQALGSLVLLVRFELTDSGLRALIPLDRPVMFCEVAANAGAFIAAGAAAVGIGSSLLGPRVQDRVWLQTEAKALVKAVQEGRSRHA